MTKRWQEPVDILKNVVLRVRVGWKGMKSREIFRNKALIFAIVLYSIRYQGLRANGETFRPLSGPD